MQEPTAGPPTAAAPLEEPTHGLDKRLPAARLLDLPFLTVIILGTR